MSAQRKSYPVDDLPDVDDEAGWAAWHERMKPEWQAKAESRNAEDPQGYRGPVRTIGGDLGHMQHGTYYDQGQATEMHRCPLVNAHGRRWNYGNEWDWAIAALALNDGSWLCWRSHSVRAPAGYDRRRSPLLRSGGFSLHSLRFQTRDAAIRANVAYVIKRARRQHRWKAKPDAQPWERTNPWPGGAMPAADAQAIIAWAMEVASRPAPALFVPPPPPPPPPPEPTDLLMWIEQGRQA